MTYSTLITRQRGVIEYFVQIAGVQYVLGTSPDAPADAWYTGGGHSYLQGLRYASIQLSCQAHPSEVWPDTGSQMLEFDDPDEILSAYLKGVYGLERTVLTAPLLIGDTVIDVVSTSGFDATGVVHVDTEAVAYAALAATQFQTLTRGYYGGAEQDHVQDVDRVPPCEPEVLSGPTDDLRGRRVTLYAAERGRTGLSAATAIWSGYVYGRCDFGPHLVRIPVAHVLRAFADGRAFADAAVGRVRGFYLPNWPSARWGRWEYFTSAAGWTARDTLVADGAEDFWPSAEALVDAWITDVNSVADWQAGRSPDGRVWIEYTGAGAAPQIKIAGELLYLLGFDGDTSSPRDAIHVSGRQVAVGQPATFFLPLDLMGPGAWERRLYLRPGESDWFVAAAVALELPGIAADDAPILAVLSVETGYLVIHRISSRGLWPPEGNLVGFGDSPPPTVRQVWEIDDADLSEVTRWLWSGESYAGAAALPYTIPARWRPAPQLLDTDCDWTELARLTALAPVSARRLALLVREPREVSKLLTGHLLACGLHAYVTATGAVGWAQTRLPGRGEPVTVGSTLLDGERVTEIESHDGRDAVLNTLLLKLTGDRGSGARRVLIADPRSAQRYGPRLARDVRTPTRALEDAATELELSVPPFVVHAADVERDLARHLAATVLALLARPRPTVRLPVTPGARTLGIGDTVSLTTRWVRDGVTGTLGVTAKLGQVLGWSRDGGLGRYVDFLDVLLIDDPPPLISPAALVTSWDNATKTLTCADTDLYHAAEDTTDLDYFEAGDVVEIVQYDTLTPSSWTATVDTINPGAGTVVLTTAPALAGSSWVLRFAAYASCSTDQQGEGWVWSADDSDGLVQNLIGGQRWA